MEPFLGDILGPDGQMSLAFRQWLAELAEAMRTQAATLADHETRISDLEP